MDHAITTNMWVIWLRPVIQYARHENMNKFCPFRRLHLDWCDDNSLNIRSNIFSSIIFFCSYFFLLLFFLSTLKLNKHSLMNNASNLKELPRFEFWLWLRAKNNSIFYYQRKSLDPIGKCILLMFASMTYWITWINVWYVPGWCRLLQRKHL